MMKKGLVIGIVVLFLGMAFVPLAGSLSIEKYVSTDKEIQSSNLDYTTPTEANVTWELYKVDGKWYVDFICDPGMGFMDRVTMYIDDVEFDTITGPGPAYVFTLQWVKALRSCTFKFVFYFGSGNKVAVIINGSDIKSYPSSQNIINMIPSSGNTINNGTLSGYVTDPLDNPIEGALIRVHFHGTYEEDYSDENGYYHVTNIPICYCMKNATCSKEGYKTEWELLSIAENTTYDFVLYPTYVYPVFDGSQCNGWWNSPITVSFVFDPEEVAEIWYSYNGWWYPYIEPFVIDDEVPPLLEYYWVNYEGDESTHQVCTFDIDYTPPTTNLEWKVIKKLPSNKWLVRFTLTAEDYISGMDHFLEFYIDDVLMDEFEVYWPSVEFNFEFSEAFKNSKFGFGCSDNACNYVIEEVNGSDIKSYSINQQSTNTLFLQILHQLMNIK